MKRLLTLALLLLWAFAAQAERITDQIEAELHAQPAAEGEPLKLLPTGTPMEVLESRDGFSRVRLGDDTEGWVESRLLTNDKLARMRLLELQAEMAQMENELNSARTEIGENPAMEGAQRRIAQLTRELEEQRTQVRPLFPGYPFEPWHLLSIPLLVLLAFLAGINYKARQVARRLGGFRV
ncbi:MAG: TIGR04211 family SH3 domain-containing protein [Candidatus Sedimenticola endophacoides]|uniref:TIGR04211 family SH3 domain-containing protein n=1 Tax=Candidatus Sedimenticola endophacoides TaxID=2548426 RepID=A0A657PXG8_9GAMM|nr:MAG: hypothetical protein B0D94_10745 [Candidatus Sedimenticola endophacoides]OQX37620.1 MAG: hypothetical protein B0D96_01870 [Candidatus Sedimenticola endophacoides]OQX39728.1 MAG: hypothetical protein B0D89_10045 [Candidatus Sedimenticola endophacoides]OQX39958.1 MAG: hypothetical protein B0D88_09030 [Candidatus Sedimenticola endophacoides]OQX46519.1 MAG: hypothetical protein B0D85_03575 [Candidatus Sedimenticola endophacoides]